MFNERVDVDKRMSLHYCKTNYDLYGLFATYPLRTAVLNSDAYELIDFELAFQYSGENHRSDPQFANYFDSLTYDDKNYFTVDEIRFLLEISAPCPPLGNRQGRRFEGGHGGCETREEYVEKPCENRLESDPTLEFTL